MELGTAVSVGRWSVLLEAPPLRDESQSSSKGSGQTDSSKDHALHECFGHFWDTVRVHTSQGSLGDEVYTVLVDL